MSELVKVVVTVPEPQADKVRQAIGEAGGGNLGDYSFTSFSVTGTGRFTPGNNANPAIGEPGKSEEVTEVRVEVTCKQSLLKNIVQAIKASHPYEEPVIDAYELIDISEI